MFKTKLVTVPLLAAAFWCTGFASVSPAQGGWRQWEIRLRDGRRLEANPLGAPDDGHLSLSVGAYERREHRIARALVRVVAAQPHSGESMPEVPALASCEDAIVLRDGTTSVGRIRLARVRWSEGVVVQRGDTVDLRDVAYLVFAARDFGSPECRRDATSHQPAVTHADFAYPVGSRQTPTLCADRCPT
jgi:hypothetical protein